MKVTLPNNLDFDLNSHAIIVGLAGSKSYGTDHPLSDTDWKGVVIPPRRYCMTEVYNFEQTGWKSTNKTGRLSEVAGIEEAEEEGTLFGIDKFINLCSACNPNVIETLFLLPEHYAILTDEGRLLIENRQLFLSQKALYTFTGYALSQLKRIKTHKSWIDNPPKSKPTRLEFELPDFKPLSQDQIQAARKLTNRHLEHIAPWLIEANNENKESFYESIYAIISLLAEELKIPLTVRPDSWLDIEGIAEVASSKCLGYDSNFMQYLQKEKAYATAKNQYDQYEGWLRNRNPARAEIEARYGFDCKHAMHLVRLLRMGWEVVTTGNLNVYREDRAELIEIRNGSWDYEQLIAWSDDKTAQLNEIVRSGKAIVPKSVNLDKIADLSIEAKEMFFKRIM